jgi:hypothetical protein
MNPGRTRRPAGTALRRTGLAAGLVAGAGVTGVFAQGLGDATLTATIWQRMQADSNYRLEPNSAGTSYFADTGITLGYLTETSTRSFVFGLNTGLRALWEAGEPFDWTFASPSSANVGYVREWADATFGTDFNYRQTNLEFDPLIGNVLDPGGPVDNIDRDTGEGIERRYDASVSLALGTDSRSAYVFSLDATHYSYSDETADQVARTEALGGLSWSLQLTPLLSSVVSGSYYYYEADDSQDTEITNGSIDAGFNYQLTNNLNVGASLGVSSRIEEETINGRRVRTEDNQGIDALARLNYAFEDFTIAGNLRVTNAAPETRLSGGLSVSYPLPRGQLYASAFQDYTGGNDGQEVRVTGAGFGLVRDLTLYSRIGVDFATAYQENANDSSLGDTKRMDAGAFFSYDLTAALTADLGYQYRYLDEFDEPADSHSVYFEIGRTFATRP